jgi:hypothetical protein
MASLTTRKKRTFLMARYGRSDIEALCKRLECRAKSVVLKDQPELVGDLKAGVPVAPAHAGVERD